MELDDDGRPKKLPGLHPQRLVDWEGQTFITDAGLRMVYPTPRVGDIIRVVAQGVSENDAFYELDGRFVHSQGDQHMLAWWVRLVNPEGWVPDAIPEA